MELQGKIIRNHDGWWLSIETRDGKRASINIESITKTSGNIVKSAFKQWAIENTSQENLPGGRISKPSDIETTFGKESEG